MGLVRHAKPSDSLAPRRRNRLLRAEETTEPCVLYPLGVHLYSVSNYKTESSVKNEASVRTKKNDLINEKRKEYI